MKSSDAFPNLNAKRPDGIRANGRPFKIMVVEDKEFQRKQLVQIFESEGYEVVDTAENGQQALQKFDRLPVPVDIITTNLDMPILDGYALLHELNQKPNKPLVIFISEDTTKGVMQDLISMGIGDFILKPVQRKLVLDRVRGCLSKIK